MTTNDQNLKTVRAKPTSEELRLFSVSGYMGAIAGRSEYSGLVYLSDLRKHVELAELRARRDAISELRDTAEIEVGWADVYVHASSKCSPNDKCMACVFEKKLSELDRQIKEIENRGEKHGEN